MVVSRRRPWRRRWLGWQRGKPRASKGFHTRVARESPVCHQRVATGDRAYPPDRHGGRTGLCWGTSRVRSERCRAAAELAGTPAHPLSPLHRRDIFGVSRSVNRYLLSGVGYSQRHRLIGGCQSKGVSAAGVRSPQPSLFISNLSSFSCDQGMIFLVVGVFFYALVLCCR